MAVIFDQRLQHPAEHGGRSPHLLEWHSSRPLLAVASKDEVKDADGAVHIHTELVNGSLPVSTPLSPPIYLHRASS